MRNFKKKISEHPEVKLYMSLTLFIAVNAAIILLLFHISRLIPSFIESVSAISLSIFSAIKPILTGLIIAYIISPLVSLIENKIISKIFPVKMSFPKKEEADMRRRRFVATIMAYVIILAAVICLLYGIAFIIIGHISAIGDISAVLDTIFSYIKDVKDDILIWMETHISPYIKTEINHLLQDISTSFFEANHWPRQLATTVNGFISFTVNALLSIIISLYLLSDAPRFKRLYRKAMHIFIPQKPAAIINETLGEIDANLKAFIKGAAIDGLIVGTSSALSLSLIGLDFGIFIGIFAGISNVIPYFGPLFSIIPAFIIGYFSDGLTYAALASATLFIIQQIDGDLLYPKIVGKKIGLHPVYIFLAVTFGGMYFGFIGMILSVPIASILKIVFSKLLFFYLERDSKNK